jgi:AcrR family transcriptional regulator
MPRVSAAHEQQVRDRIVRAALGVFNERGYHRATMQDVVRASGLSVGAIYTYFAGKDELFLAACVLSMDQGFGELGDRLGRGGTTAEKLAIAVGFFIDGIDPIDVGTPGSATYLVQAWAEAGQSETVRETLVRRREQIAAVGQILIREGIVRGELPAWLDVEAAALGYSALLDGLLLQRIEEGDRWRREDAERRAFAVLELLIAATAATERPAVPRPRAEPFSLKTHGGAPSELAS